MASKRRTTAKWASLNSDLLLNIFHPLEPHFLLSTVAFVCRPWGRVCFNRFLTGDGEETLDLGGLKSDDTGLLLPTRRVSKAGLMKLIRAVMDVYSCDDGHGDGTRVAPFTKMVFPFGPFVWCDAHLVYVAERLPDLRELTLPCGSEITHKGFSRALRYWNEIEKMSIGPFQHNYDVYRIIEAAGIICKKLEVLSLSGFFINQQLSPQIAQNLKGVKLLRLEKAYIGKVALKNILSKCKKLQKVEIWHCLTLEEPHNLKNLLNLFWQ